MAIAYNAAGSGNGTETSGAQLSLTCPATVNSNDILIAHILITGTSISPTTPSGWTLLYGPGDLGVTIVTARHWVYGKLADGSEDGATVDFGNPATTEGRAGRIYSFTGYVSGTITDVVPAASFSSNPNDTDPPGPSVTTTVAGALAVALKAQDDNNTQSAITGMTGGTWTQQQSYTSTTWGPQGIAIAIDTCTPTADPGTVSGGTSATTNDECGTIGFEIRPTTPGLSITPSAISSSETTGSSTLKPGSVATSVSAIASTEAFGSHTVSAPGPSKTISPSAATSTEAFGSVTINKGGVNIAASAIASAEVFGSVIFRAGTVFVIATNISSAESLGSVALVGPSSAAILPAAIISQEFLGAMLAKATFTIDLN